MSMRYRSDTKTFRKASLYKKRWHLEGTFTLAEFKHANAHDAFVLEEIVPELEKLKVGKAYTYNGGAGGVDRFTRVS